MILVADSSGLIAAFNKADPEHAAVAAALDAAGLVVISPLALVEIDHVVTARATRHAADRVIDRIRAQLTTGRAQLATINESTLDAALWIRRRYESIQPDLADAVNVALAAHYRTDAILTLDRRDFRVLRPLSGYDYFRVLPDDAGSRSGGSR